MFDRSRLITTFEDMKGKVIENCFYAEHSSGSDYVVIIFDSGEFCAFENENEYDNDLSFKQCFKDEEFRKLGIATKEEIEKYEDEQRKIKEKMEKEVKEKIKKEEVTRLMALMNKYPEVCKNGK